jgi:PAS domain S-box-containing protein
MLDAQSFQDLAAFDPLTSKLRLSPRQREVLNGILSGKPNKIIAHGLGLSTRTVEAHRAAIMSKVGVSSVVDLVRRTSGSEPSHDHAELALNAYPGLVSFWDKTLVGRFANAPAENSSSQDVPAILGANMKDFLGELLFNRSLPYIRRALKGEHQQFRQLVRKPGQGRATYLTHYVPHLDAKGAVDGFFAFAMDISAIAETEEPVEPTRKKTSGQAQMIMNEACMILSVNAAFTHVTRYRAQEAVGRTPVIIKPAGVEQLNYMEFWKAIVAERAWQGTVWYRRRDGYLFRCKQSVTVHTVAGGRPHYCAQFSEFMIPAPRPAA